MWDIAFSDGTLDVNEERLIRRIADLIRIKDVEVLKLKDKAQKLALQNYLEENGVETRPLCSGNLLRQPFLSEYSINLDNPKVDYLHFHGFFPARSTGFGLGE